MKTLTLICLLLLCVPDLTPQSRQKSEGYGRQAGRELRQANDGPVRGPLLGFVSLQEDGVRPIRGIPGAASLGPAIAGIPEFRAAALSSLNGFLLGVRAVDDRLVLICGLGRREQLAGLPVIASGVSLLVLSPSERTAAIYDRPASRITVLKGLPDDPKVSWSAALDALPGELAALAVRDDGGEAMAAAGGSLITVARGGDWRHIASVDGAVRLSYLNDSSDAVYVDAGRKRMHLLRRSEGGISVIPLAGEADGLAAPEALALSRDNRRAFVANSDPAQVLVVDLRTGLIESTPCSCAVTGVTPLAGNAVFQISSTKNQAVCVFDGTRSEPRLSYIPPPLEVSRMGGVR